VDPFLVVSLGLVLAVLALAVMVRVFTDRTSRLREELRSATDRGDRLAQMHERVAAQWAPVLSRYPYDVRGFRFTGSPASGVQFEEDRLVVVAFTSGPLAPEQQRVRDLVQAGKVEWLEVRLDEAAPAASAPPPEAPADAWQQP
jgi:predicted Holliday junction resolvase-like endonuclease